MQLKMLKNIGISERPYFEPEPLIEEVINPCFRASKTVKLLSLISILRAL